MRCNSHSFHQIYLTKSIHIKVLYLKYSIRFVNVSKYCALPRLADLSRDEHRLIIGKCTEVGRSTFFGGMEIWNEIRKNRKMTQVEREHVHSVYSQIAPHFSDTRFKPWPRIAQFLKEQPVGSIIADVGE